MDKLTKIYEQIQSKILFRGTLKEISKELSKITDTQSELVSFAESLPTNDLGYNIFLGMVGAVYLDYEVYLLSTNVENVFIITEINRV